VVVPAEAARPSEPLTAAFYDRQHDDPAYRQNNWLVDQLARIVEARPRTLVEVGSGNGRFLRAVAPHVEHATGLDWATSPELLNLPPNVTVLRSDVVNADIPLADIVCSADVLEHFAPRQIDALVGKLVRAGTYQHHVIACYDDGHTHLSILPPAAWLAVFRKHQPAAYLADVHYRRRDPSQTVCIISTLPRSGASAMRQEL
jgi:cyclopropane fatty-acyl-phospholipid synthase-like methyltransferase